MDPAIQAQIDALSDEEKAQLADMISAPQNDQPSISAAPLVTPGDYLSDAKNPVSDIFNSQAASLATEPGIGGSIDRGANWVKNNILTHIGWSSDEDQQRQATEDYANHFMNFGTRPTAEDMAGYAMGNTGRDMARVGANGALAALTLGGGAVAEQAFARVAPEVAPSIFGADSGVGALASRPGYSVPFNVGKATAFGAGAETGNFWGDQAMQATGLQQDTPIGQDALQALTNIPKDAAIGSVLGALTGGTGLAADASLSRIDETYDPTRKLYGAYGVTDPDARKAFDYLSGKGIVDDPIAAQGAAYPAFKGADDKLAAFKQEAGSDLGNIRKEIIADPNKVSPSFGSVKDLLTDEEKADFAGRFAPNEVIQGVSDSLSKLKTKEAQQASDEIVFGKARKPLSIGDVDAMDRAENALSTTTTSLDAEAYQFNDILKARQSADQIGYGSMLSTSPETMAVQREARDRAAGLRTIEKGMGSASNPEYNSLEEAYHNASIAQPYTAGREQQFLAGPTSAAPDMRARILGTIGGPRLSAWLSSAPDQAEAIKMLRIATGVQKRPEGFEAVLNGIGGVSNATSNPGVGAGISSLANQDKQTQWDNAGLDQLASGASKIGSVVPPANAFAENNNPRSNISPLTGPFAQDLSPVATPMREGFSLPRDVSMVDPGGMERIMFSYFPEDQRVPIALQWRSVVASGDRRQMASMLGAIAESYPDFPLQRGVITGYPSEFDIGDGKTRLFSPNDIGRWEQEIERAPLSESEKAQRVMALRQDQVVVPMTVKTVNLGNSQPMSAVDLSVQSLNRRGGAAPETQGTQGNRRTWP